MSYKVLTIEREFGSGGEAIAEKLATWLGWRLLDEELLNAIAQAAHVDPEVVRLYDETSSSRIPRITSRGGRATANHSGNSASENAFFDSAMMGEFSHRIMEEATSRGGAVIVGRGAQCILQNKQDIFHVFIYAPLQQRIQRLSGSLPPGSNVEQRIRSVDQERTEFLLQRFGKTWNSHQLYDLMISSSQGEDRTARMLLYAMTGHL